MIPYRTNTVHQSTLYVPVSLCFTSIWSERRTDKLAKCCIRLKTFLIPIIVKFDLLFFISMLGVTTLNFVFHQKHGLVTLENL